MATNLQREVKKHIFSYFRKLAIPFLQHNHLHFMRPERAFEHQPSIRITLADRIRGLRGFTQIAQVIWSDFGRRADLQSLIIRRAGFPTDAPPFLTITPRIQAGQRQRDAQLPFPPEHFVCVMRIGQFLIAITI